MEVLPTHAKHSGSVTSDVSPLVAICIGARSPEEGGCSISATAEDWHEALPTIISSRLSSRALAVMRNSPSLDPDDQNLAGLLRQTALAEVSFAMAVEAETRTALDALKASGILFLVIKGPASARFYREPAERTYRDIDVLVAPKDFRKAQRILEKIGFHADPIAHPWRWFETVCVEGINMAKETGYSVDLHHRIAPWRFSQGLSFSQLMSRSAQGSIGGLIVHMPSKMDAILIAVLHILNDLWKGDPSLLSWRDIAVMTENVLPDDLQTAFKASGLAWLYKPVCDRLISLGVVRLEDGWGKNQPIAPSREWRRVEKLGWSASTVFSRHPAGWVLRLPALRGLAYLIGTAFPSQRTAKSSHSSYWAYWAAAVKSIRDTFNGADLRPKIRHMSDADK